MSKYIFLESNLLKNITSREWILVIFGMVMVGVCIHFTVGLPSILNNKPLSDNNQLILKKLGIESLCDNCITILKINENCEKCAFELKFHESLRYFNDLLNEYGNIYRGDSNVISNILKEKATVQAKFWCRDIRYADRSVVLEAFRNSSNSIKQGRYNKCLNVLVTKSINIAIVYEYLKSKQNRDPCDLLLFHSVEECLKSFFQVIEDKTANFITALVRNLIEGSSNDNTANSITALVQNPIEDPSNDNTANCITALAQNLIEEPSNRD